MTPDTAQLLAIIVSALVALGTWVYVVLQYGMWREFRRQNDLTSKPLLRLRDRRVRKEGDQQQNVKVSSGKIIGRVTVHRYPLVDKSDARISADWQDYLKTGANLAALPDDLVCVEVENYGQGMAIAFGLSGCIVVAPHEGDKLVPKKTYEIDLTIEQDIRSSAVLRVALFELKFVPHAEIELSIDWFRDALNVKHELKPNDRPKRLFSVHNEAIDRLLDPNPPKTPEHEDEYDPWAEE